MVSCPVNANGLPGTGVAVLVGRGSRFDDQGLGFDGLRGFRQIERNFR